MFRTSAKTFFRSWCTVARLLRCSKLGENREKKHEKSMFFCPPGHAFFEKLHFLDTRDLEIYETKSHQISGACQACSELVQKRFLGLGVQLRACYDAPNLEKIVKKNTKNRCFFVLPDMLFLKNYIFWTLEISKSTKPNPTKFQERVRHVQN
jgi:hypothetical protein